MKSMQNPQQCLIQHIFRRQSPIIPDIYTFQILKKIQTWQVQPPQNVKWKCFLEFSIVSGPASRLSHIHYSTLSALLQLSFQTFSLAGALSDFYIVSYWSNILLRSQQMAWFNQIRQCVFHWSIYLYLKVNTSVMPKNSILWLLN